MRRGAIQATNASAEATRRDRFGRAATLSAALLIIVLTIAVIAFIAAKGVATFTRDGVSLIRFLTGTVWRPEASSAGAPEFGILPFLTGSLTVSFLAIIIAAILGIPTAIFFVEISPRWARKSLQSAIELFAGIPSVVYGWLGLTLLVPFIRTHIGGLGFSVLAAGIVLATMILPTIISIAADSLKSVPRELNEAALALGATRWQAVAGVIFPAALPGILTGVVLGIARAFGETLAVQMVVGNTKIIPNSLLGSTTTLTSGITMDMGYSIAGTPWNDALWSMALVLLAMSLLFILAVRWFGKRGAYR